MNLQDRSKWVAVIGSRNASEEENKTAYNLGKRLAKRGDIVVSGLAKGIDAYAHMGALDGGGKTIAIVSTSINEKIYPPENKELSERIKQNGCIIHPFDNPTKYTSNGMSPKVKRLIERSILNAYVCPNIVVVKDSCSIITGGTKWATKYGMDIGHNVFRLDSNNKWYENPLVENCKVSWIRELIFEDILLELNKFV